jgi:virginiamycin B lyase
LGRWDPITRKITEYAHDPGTINTSGDSSEGASGAGQKHTVRIDPSGNVWSSGIPLTKFDPKTGKYTHFPDATVAYDIEIAPNGDVWFTNPDANKLGKVDGKTMQLSMWVMPTPNIFPRRLEVAPDGMIWVGEAGFPLSVGKMARFDPKTRTFKEYKLPGPDPSPDAMGFDAEGYLWYSSHYMDTVNRLDTKTGKVTEYPFPHPEIMLREFFRDARGRVWYGSSPNNKVGYFYLAGNK